MRSRRPFKIAHLSDLHLTRTDRKERSERKLLGELKGRNAAFRRIVASAPIQGSDLVVVTGDVTGLTNAMGRLGYYQLVNLAGKPRRYRTGEDRGATRDCSIWATGCSVSTIGLDKEATRLYLRDQEKRDSGQGATGWE